MLPVSHVDLTDPRHIKRSQTPPPGKASARPQRCDHSPSALPLSAREQQVIAQRNDGVKFEKIAVRCALAKIERTTAIPLAPLEQSDHKAIAERQQVKAAHQAFAEPPRDRPSFAPAFRCIRSPFHPQVQKAPALRPNSPKLCVSKLSAVLVQEL